MADVKLVKSIYTVSDVTSLGELAAADNAKIPGTLEVVGAALALSINALTPTALATGFTIAGGTESKTLTVDETVAMSSKAPKASPTFTGDVTLAGKVTNATLPAFLVMPAVAQENIAVGSEVTVVWGTEIKDQGNNFAANIFTAPVTGLYQLSLLIQLLAVDTATTDLEILIRTSNRDYAVMLDPSRCLISDGILTFSLSVLADMDATDTAYVIVYQATGTQQIDVTTISRFGGFLVC